MREILHKNDVRLTLRSVTLAFKEGTKGDKDIRIAPSFKSKNLGLSASLTEVEISVAAAGKKGQHLRLSSKTLLSTSITSAWGINSFTLELCSILPSSNSISPTATPHILQRI